MTTFSNNFEGLWSITQHKISDFSLQNQGFAVGVSGGADSIGLFHVFSDLLKQNLISRLVVFHINFGLRGDESDGDERFVRQICECHNIPIEVFRPTTPIVQSIQENARLFRLEAQEKFLKQGFKIALAHNCDDVVENIMFRLARGSSISQAAGMTYFDGEIFRPWLGVTRQHIRDALRQKHINWREDSSNAKSLYARNKIRHHVLPVLEELFPGATRRIADNFLNLPNINTDAQLEEDQTLDMSFFRELAQSAIGDHVHKILTNFYGSKSPVPRQVIAQISKSIHTISTGLDGTPKTFCLPGGVELFVTKSKLSLRQHPS